jgi:hypothetical protein
MKNVAKTWAMKRAIISISDAMELLIAHIVQNTLRVMRQHRPVEVSGCSPS